MIITKAVQFGPNETNFSQCKIAKGVGFDFSILDNVDFENIILERVRTTTVQNCQRNQTV